MNKSIVVIAIQTILLIVVIFLLFKKCDREKTLNTLLQSKNQTLKITTNKLGQQTATIQVMEGKLSDAKKVSQIDKKIIEELKKHKNKVTSSTIVRIHTSDTIQGKPVIVNADCDSIAFTAHLEKKTVSGEVYSSYEMYMDRDSVNLISNVKNKLVITQRFEKNQPVVDVTTLNPNTGIDEVQSYKVTQKKKRAGLWIALAVLAGFLIGSQ